MSSPSSRNQQEESEDQNGNTDEVQENEQSG
jgi:hypothetical protein